MPHYKAKNIRGLLFDKDGTLIDFEKSWFTLTYELALMAAGGNDKKARELLSLGGYDFVQKRFKGDSVIASGTLFDLVKLWHPTLNHDDIHNKIYEYNDYSLKNALRFITEINGTTQSLKILKQQNYILGIATNDTRINAVNCVNALGWQDYFCHIIGYNSVKNAKPAKDQILLFANLTGLNVNEIAMIGDNNHDISAARAAQAGLAIGVLSGTGKREELEQNCDILCDNVMQVTAWLIKSRQ